MIADPRLFRFVVAGLAFAIVAPNAPAEASSRPNIILVMADDQGWGQVGYYNHPILKTPNLDAMARNGLRFDRFYAGASNCSPTRATVLTGRTNDRTGVFNHGFPLRLQEKTVARALRDAGYATGHFGKWHLNGLRGPGVPILASDTHHPGAFGFDTWLSATNFIDRNPILSRNGHFEEFQGDSSEVVVREALQFLRSHTRGEKPVFAVIWYGSPHDPMVAGDADRAAFAELPEKHQHHYGELVALDRSVGALRKGLRDLGIADNTLLWYCSDNGGLANFGPETMGGLRGHKGQMHEGGLRVPGIIEWPSVITSARITEYPAGTVDIFPTVVDVAGLPSSAMLQPQDGISLRPLLDREIGPREKPLRFRHMDRGVWMDNQYKLLVMGGKYELYDLDRDPHETQNLASQLPDVFQEMKKAYLRWDAAVEASVAGRDYPSGTLDPDQPERRFWMDEEAYRPYFDAWKQRPEYAGRLKNR